MVLRSSQILEKLNRTQYIWVQRNAPAISSMVCSQSLQKVSQYVFTQNKWMLLSDNSTVNLHYTHGYIQDGTITLNRYCRVGTYTYIMRIRQLRIFYRQTRAYTRAKQESKLKNNKGDNASHMYIPLLRRLPYYKNVRRHTVINFTKIVPRHYHLFVRMSHQQYEKKNIFIIMCRIITSQCNKVEKHSTAYFSIRHWYR